MTRLRTRMTGSESNFPVTAFTTITNHVLRIVSSILASLLDGRVSYPITLCGLRSSMLASLLDGRVSYPITFCGLRSSILVMPLAD